MVYRDDKGQRFEHEPRTLEKVSDAETEEPGKIRL